MMEVGEPTDEDVLLLSLANLWESVVLCDYVWKIVDTATQPPVVFILFLGYANEFREPGKRLLRRTVTQLADRTDALWDLFDKARVEIKRLPAPAGRSLQFSVKGFCESVELTREHLSKLRPLEQELGALFHEIIEMEWCDERSAGGE
jgi:hypothetical protein